MTNRGIEYNTTTNSINLIQKDIANNTNGVFGMIKALRAKGEMQQIPLLKQKMSPGQSGR